VLYVPMRADDSAVAVGAGGVRLSKESRISMEKERLVLGNKIIVDFDFLNESDQDITLEVGFPVPPYEWYAWEPGVRRDFSDFHVWVDGKSIQYQTDVRAKVKGDDVTDLVRRSGLALDFAENNPEDPGIDTPLVHTLQPEDHVLSLSPAMRTELVNAGAIKAIHKDDYVFLWEVYKNYHWTQTFPAHKVVHIHHEYSPQEGYEPVKVGELQKELKDGCIDDSLAAKMRAEVAKRLKSGDTNNGDYVYPQWINYILTSANSWKTPIKSFDLVVERPKPDPASGAKSYYVSLCWDGKIEHPDPDHFTMHVTDFVPKRELTVYFLPAN